MLMRLMRVAFAVLVMVAFGCMPTLATASPANESPPMVVVATAPEVALECDMAATNYFSDTGGADVVDRPVLDERPGYPLRE
jgi:hypothetical protein